MEPGDTRAIVAWFGLLVIPVVTAPVAVILAPRATSPDFYGACAQIIPVLMLVLLIERRAFDWRAAPRTPTGLSDPDPKLLASSPELQRLVRINWRLSVAQRFITFAVLLVVIVGGEVASLVALSDGRPHVFAGKWAFTAIAVGFVTLVINVLVSQLEPLDSGEKTS